MRPDVLARHTELGDLCRHYQVKRLDLFGSAATGTPQADLGDLDFLVEFETPSAPNYADNYFGLREALERLFGLPVDLVVASAIRNPYFRDSVEGGRLSVYAA